MLDTTPSNLWNLQLSAFIPSNLRKLEILLMLDTTASNLGNLRLYATIPINLRNNNIPTMKLHHARWLELNDNRAPCIF